MSLISPKELNFLVGSEGLEMDIWMGGYSVRVHFGSWWVFSVGVWSSCILVVGGFFWSGCGYFGW